MSEKRTACGVNDEAGHICKRQSGHPGVHEHYEHGKTISWPNASGWFVAESRDEDGPYWYLTMCEITNRRGDRR